MLPVNVFVAYEGLSAVVCGGTESTFLAVWADGCRRASRRSMLRVSFRLAGSLQLRLQTPTERETCTTKSNG